MNATRMRIPTLGLALAAGCGRGDDLREEARALTVDPAASGLGHIVVVMMENRSFDRSGAPL
jgi:phospholipase C